MFVTENEKIIIQGNTDFMQDVKNVYRKEFDAVLHEYCNLSERDRKIIHRKIFFCILAHFRKKLTCIGKAAAY